MKNKTKKIVITSILGVALFATGSVVGFASSQDWLTQISIDASKEINSAGNTKTDALLTNVDDKIKDKVIAKADPIIDEKMKQLQAELQAYFDTKLNSVTDSAQYDAVVADLERIKKVLLDNYKYEIDQAFVGK